MPPDLPPDISLRHLTYDAGHEPVWQAMLSADERARMAGFAHAGRRRAFLLGRVAARTLLAHRLALDPTAVPLRVDPDGAPVVAAPSTPALYVSIAHSGDRAVAAAGHRPLGVDLEHVRPRHPNLHRYLLHASEYALLERLPMPRDEALILCWTLKEATLKALRTGLRLSPRTLQLAVDPAAQAAVVAVEGRGTWQARYVELDGAYLAVAFPDGPATPARPASLEPGTADAPRTTRPDLRRDARPPHGS